MFKENLELIKADLHTYNKITPVELFHNCITEKLAATLRRYNAEIDMNTDFLLSKSSARVLKALTKIQKRNDKEMIEKNIDIDEDEYYD